MNQSMNFRKVLLAFQIFIHLSFLLGLLFVPLKMAIPFILVSQVVYVGFCGTVYFHRVIAHRNEIHPWINRALLFLSWLGVSGSVIAWAGTHRKHHRLSDSERDPHSPVHRGIFRTYWYSSGDEDIVKYVPDLLRQKLFLFQHKHYFKFLVGIHILGFLTLPLHFYWGFLIVPAFLMWFAGSTINVFCHNSLGPINIPVLGFLHAGEGWHKNHHASPALCNFGHKGDWGYLLYNLIKTKKAKA